MQTPTMTDATLRLFFSPWCRCCAACFGLQYKCSYHQGNCYMTLFVRVFEPPSVSPENLLNTGITITERVKGGLLVEVQLLEGDHLSFSTLFREILVNFSKVRSGKRARLMPHRIRTPGITLWYKHLRTVVAWSAIKRLRHLTYYSLRRTRVRMDL